MSESWGGARTPTNPAVVSGPGAMSARTDGGVLDPNAPEYGEGVEIQNLQAEGASGMGGGAPGGGGFAGVDLSGVTPLGAPGQSGLPVTAGADVGAGPGPEALGLPMDPAAEERADVAALDPAFIQVLLAASTRSDATPSFRRAVRKIVMNQGS